MILCSIFRDSAAYIDRHVQQVKALREHLPVTVIAVEGDSTDDTYERLFATDYVLLKVEHGGPKYGSVDIPQRWRQIAVAGNAALCAAVRLCGDQPTVYVESDLIWTPDDMLTLVDDLSMVPAVAPMSMCFSEERFYDTWGYRRHGEYFRPFPPYFAGWTSASTEGGGLTVIDSCGSCFAVRPEVLPHVQFSHVDCPRGVGRTIRDAGFSLWLDPAVAVRHP